MMEFLAGIAIFFIGFWVGRKLGIAQTMIRMQNIMMELEKVRKYVDQWNEDLL